ncbi:MAG: pantoate--beta-alanine ligase [Candidatus Omnitrophica bacterium]|nr:pantoate--beta-alanine ligase [Candidatus Omnitrophota bacterium]
MFKNKAYISIGSNIPPRRKFIDEATKRLRRDSNIALIKRSSIYETCPNGSNFDIRKRFLNGVVEIETSLGPSDLMSRLLGIERSLGRTDSKRCLDRAIDLDILLYNDDIVSNGDVVIPHPRMHERDFVILPLMEVSPDTVHPVIKKRIRDIYNAREMKVFTSPQAAYNHLFSEKISGKRIGFVPTMGYLHEGHASLLRRARRENDLVVLSIFVNPTQFSAGEDYKRYPRDLKRDARVARKEGVDVIFHPSASDMYKKDNSTRVDVEGLSENLCGRYRPGHFRGVATVVAKLLNVIPADVAYFGQKDAQQAFIIKRMIRDLNMAVKIKILPTVREKDGLAMSSRNRYLSAAERREAPVGYRSLILARKMIEKGEKRSEKVIRSMKDFVHRNSNAKIQYILIVDKDTLKDVKTVKGAVLIAIAFYFGGTRLIDNMIVN